MDANASKNPLEFDLRASIRRILKRWYWILIAVVVTVGVALLGSYLLPDEYQSSSSIIITKQGSVLEFDPRISTQTDIPDVDGIPDLALSEGIIYEVITQARQNGVELESVKKLREDLQVDVSASVIVLSVRNENPDDAAMVANLWTEIVVQVLNDLYNPSIESSKTYFQQASNAFSDWQAAQALYVEFQEANEERVLLRELAVQERALAHFLEADRRLGLVVRDAQAISARLEALEPGQPTNLRQELDLLYLSFYSLVSGFPTPMEPVELDSRNVQDGMSGNLPETGASSSIFYSQAADSFPLDIQLLATDEGLDTEPIEDQIQFLDKLIESVELQRGAIVEDLTRPKQEILDLQYQIASLQEERVQLENERDLAQETYLSLARKARETSISSQDTDPVVKIASAAVPKESSISPGSMQLIVIGGFVGGLLGLAFATIVAWWNDE